MVSIDESIKDVSKVIRDNIECFDIKDRGILSQNILGNLRNLVEYVAQKICGDELSNPNDYKEKTSALNEIKSRGDLHFIYKFHKMLQISVSHYTVDNDGAERLMLKYYQYLIQIKNYLSENFDLDILENIEDFPLVLDPQLNEYYRKISYKIDEPEGKKKFYNYNDRYYIQKSTPFFVNGRIYFAVTLTTADSNNNKFERIIAFTKHDMLNNYAVKLSISDVNIEMLGKSMPIKIIEDWKVSIRPCELNNFASIFGIDMNIRSDSKEYSGVMSFLTRNKMPLSELMSSSEEYYDKIMSSLFYKSHDKNLWNVFNHCRDIIINEKNGCNIVRYLLFIMNNKVIKLQISNNQCPKLSDLYLQYSCIPFEEIPYNSSLRYHNPRLYNLFECVPINGREDELFARYIRNKTEIDGVMFVPVNEIDGFDDIGELIERYNGKLYYKHFDRRKMTIYKNTVFIEEYVQDVHDIVTSIKEKTKTGVDQYTSSVQSWIDAGADRFDDKAKKEALLRMFSSSCVSVIYGAAGTGKSTMISYVSDFFSKFDKLYLANTNSAVDNLRKKVQSSNSRFLTINKFLNDSVTAFDKQKIIFVDECSTVSNSDMKKLLDRAKCDLLILVGDVYQIESIRFGNWFDLIREFIPEDSVFELSKPFRTKSQDLLCIWDRVRKFDNNFLEPLVKGKYTEKLDETVFCRTNPNEIVLCLNYDGLYGINNINRMLQNNNPEREFRWGINTYKVNDPVLFNNSKRFSPLIFNNLKGRIVDIRQNYNSIHFDIGIDMTINGLEASDYDFDLLKPGPGGNSIIGFDVGAPINTDGDISLYDDSIVPFQVAYAVSIHKAQGLEYDSVKILITNEAEERITHNIFYTAITRARKSLKIYWSPETESLVINNFVKNDNRKDVSLIKTRYPDL